MLNVVIQNVRDPELYWVMDQGWSEGEATIFSQVESSYLNLPIDGKWIKYEYQVAEA